MFDFWTVPSHPFLFTKSDTFLAILPAFTHHSPTIQVPIKVPIKIPIRVTEKNPKAAVLDRAKSAYPGWRVSRLFLWWFHDGLMDY